MLAPFDLAKSWIGSGEPDVGGMGLRRAISEFDRVLAAKTGRARR
jgi:hypothetical protein